MRFTETEPTENFDIRHFVSEANRWEWGICQMLFDAYRVNISLVGQHTYLVSYFCKPAKSATLWCGVVSGIMLHLQETMTAEECMAIFPIQTIKPLEDDKQCVEDLLFLSAELAK